MYLFEYQSKNRGATFTQVYLDLINRVTCQGQNFKRNTGFSTHKKNPNFNEFICQGHSKHAKLEITWRSSLNIVFHKSQPKFEALQSVQAVLAGASNFIVKFIGRCLCYTRLQPKFKKFNYGIIS